MTNTTNFNFSIPDGTDNVNLLTQNYPNWTSLDAILKAVKDTGITTATATKTGTNFAIVRNDADCKNFEFVATANYVAADTFTVDGVPVTATAVDGTALVSGAFVINQTVVAVLNGTVMTVLVGGGISSLPASDVTYDNTGSGLTATNVQDAIDEVVNDIPANAAALSYDNTVSGLTATDVQAAIDELSSTGSPAYVLKATGTAGQTYAQQLTALQTAFSALTTAQKMRSVIKNGDFIYFPRNWSIGVYVSENVGASETSIESLNVRDAQYRYSFENSGTWARQDRSSNTSSSAIELYVLE